MLFEPVIEEFSFTSQGNRLVGDLTRPPWPGPHPAVVFVEGSGPGGRDLGTWPVKLAAAGFASLAYDKPGSGESTGDWTTQSLDDRVAETLAAVEAIGGRASLIGGSQGGWVAHLAAARSAAVQTAITVSGPGVGVLEQEEYRLRKQLPALGFGASVDQALALLREQLAGGDPEQIYASQAAWHDADWYPLLAGNNPGAIAFLARIAGYDPREALGQVRCPLLAIFGEEDVQVPVAQSAKVIGELGHDVVIFPGGDHGIRGSDGQRVAGFDELIVSWLHRKLPVR